MSAAAAGLSVAATAGPARAADGAMLDEAAFVAKIRTTAKHRQAIGTVRVNDGACLQFAVNTLNGFATWGEPAANVQVAMTLAGSGCVLGLGDAAWKTYHFAELLKKFPNEFMTPDGTQGNPWAHASATLPASADPSIPALVKRGVRIYICNTALGAMANRIIAAGYGEGGDIAAVTAKLRTHALPGTEVVPAGISALVVLQENGYTYYSAAL
jgi:hypothetical protein